MDSSLARLDPASDVPCRPVSASYKCAATRNDLSCFIAEGTLGPRRVDPGRQNTSRASPGSSMSDKE
jgi:hypothetical protein